MKNQTQFNSTFDNFFQHCKTIAEAACDTILLNNTVVDKSGNEYVRIFTSRDGITGTNAWAFIDKITGDIFKPINWNMPARYARGNIFDNEIYNLVTWSGIASK